jgi:hypothetical protein
MAREETEPSALGNRVVVKWSLSTISPSMTIRLTLEMTSKARLEVASGLPAVPKWPKAIVSLPGSLLVLPIAIVSLLVLAMAVVSGLLETMAKVSTKTSSRQEREGMR